MKFNYLIVFLSLIVLNVNAKIDTLNYPDSNKISDSVVSRDELIDNHHADIDSSVSLFDTMKIKIIGDVVTKSNKRDYLNLIFPILTLLLGFFLNRGYEILSEKKKIQMEGNRWIAELRGLEEPLKQQKEAIDGFLKKHAIDIFEAYQMLIHQSLNCEIFSSLDKSKLLGYLKDKTEDFDSAVKLSNEVHGFTGSVKYVHDLLIKLYDEYKASTNKHFDSFNDNLQLFMQSFARTGAVIEKRIKADPLNDSAYKQVFDLIEEFITPHNADGKIEIFGLQNSFILPLAKIFSINRLNEDFNELSIHLSNTNIAVKSIRMEKVYMKNNLEFANDKVGKSLDSLSEIITKLT